MPFAIDSLVSEREKQHNKMLKFVELSFRNRARSLHNLTSC